MIEPYGMVINSMIHEFRKLDLSIRLNTDYEITLANNEYELIIATERFYQPSVLARVRDRTNMEFEVGLCERILAEQQFMTEARNLDQIRDQYHLEMAGVDAATRKSGIYIYVRASMRRIFNFLSEYSHEIIDENGPFRHEYRSREQIVLSNFGL